MNIPKKFKRFMTSLQKFAKVIYSDPKKLRRFLDSVSDYAKKNKKHVEKLWDDLVTLYDLLLAWMKGEYTEVPIGLIIWAIIALAYFIMPIDVVPDFIGPAGFIDDAFVLTMVLREFKEEIEKFRLWQNAKKDKQKAVKSLEHMKRKNRTQLKRKAGKSSNQNK